MSDFYTLKWTGNALSILDQRELPGKEKYITLRTYNEVIRAIKSLAIRGAPAIGSAGAFGVVLGALGIKSRDIRKFKEKIDRICREIIKARPTAVNLSWAINRMKSKIDKFASHDVEELKKLIVMEAERIYQEDIQANLQIGKYGERLVPSGATILTHCNAGALATAGYGTALGVIRRAWEKGKVKRVYADETRPVLQGARLTAWELHKEGIPVTVMTDNMAGAIMKKGEIDMVIVGADRIAANGDFANKIGTYGLSILAKFHNIPFYVAAPRSTFDLNLRSGDDIIIEMRDRLEVLKINGKMIAPPSVDVWNPAFDVTPHHLVTAFITNMGIIRPPYLRNIKKLIFRDEYK